ncbi:thiaminase II [Pontibacillus marinus]|uniref:Aminopyrimidine aminohydrolase n=1 Tax=Pontibacillus marinus BH030004 = DSM 16465 TaxID=1385511 RepID=A0A0A5G0B5_9BACI|nr:thiaminase II [Pontibacillus marinus]KGX86531.1 thiaminase [Pontibacillus marinus BH030004 = DSM 16465]
MSFTQECRKEADSIWEESFHHPFIQELTEGTLSFDQFRYYVLQDSYYLSHFARVQSFAGAKAEDLETTSRLAAHAQGTYQAELGLHETFAKELGITEEEKNVFQPSPTAYAYTSHLYRSALLGDLGMIISSLLPCYWLYYEIGQRFKDYTPGVAIYEEWINTYGSEWFKSLVEEQINRLDQLAEKSTPKQRQAMKETFLISSQYELKFWEMAYTLESWNKKEQTTS